MKEKYAILEDFLNGQSSDIDHERMQLIRILSRSGTLPKISDLQVKYIHSQPEMFLIEPGKQLRMGIRLLQQPVLSMVALRYGIEWHIWHQAVQKADGDFRVADLAAACVAIKFIDLLPDEDRKALAGSFPDDLVNLYELMRSPDFKVEDFDKIDSYEIAKFHKLQSPNTPINPAWFEIIKNLAVPTESLMMSGGDLRLNIETRHLLNVYGCRPFPRPEAYSFASSTATSVSNFAFDQTQIQREKLIKNSFKHGFAATMQHYQGELVDRLKSHLQLGKNSAIITSPSGTDISLLFAGICQAIYGEKVAHILVASDETGSGVPMALAGRHFADTSALNIQVKKEEAIAGFAAGQVIKIPIRDEKGILKTAHKLDDEVSKAIIEALAKGLKPVLHVMDQSKLGYAAPSAAFLDKLNDTFKKQVLVLVDNSQLRMDTKRINQYVKKSFFITVTGSKFYTGPPFCGALVIPEVFSTRIRDCNKKLPIGFKDYYLKSEFMAATPMGDVLAEGYNVGSYLRWFAAKIEVERFQSVPYTLRKVGREMFCEHVANKLQNTSFLEPLEQLPTNDSLPLPIEPRTIFPFFILKDGQVLSQPRADRVYRLLNQDISALANFESDVEQRIARQVCHIGQPVKVLYHNQVPSAVVRISLGSRIISESWRDRDVSLFFQRIENQMNQVDIIINKIGLILKYGDELIGEG